MSEKTKRKNSERTDQTQRRTMKITELIEGYADMTAEERLAALEAYEPDTSETDKWKKQYDKTAHDLAEIKKTNRALQEQLDSKLTDDERARKEQEDKLADIIAERDNLKREMVVSKRTAELIGLGYTKELAESSATALCGLSDEDFSTVVGNAGTFKTGFEQAVRAGIVKNSPVPTDKGSATKTMTKEEIMAIKDTTKRQKAIAENIELFQ